MTDIPNFNLDDVPPYFLHLVRQVFQYLNILHTAFKGSIPEGYLDPDSHEHNVFTLKELRRLNDEIYNLGRIDARAPTHMLGLPCQPMRGEKAAIERLLHFKHNNPESSGVLRFLSIEPGETE